jgi:hypothetical protein
MEMVHEPSWPPTPPIRKVDDVARPKYSSMAFGSPPVPSPTPVAPCRAHDATVAMHARIAVMRFN